MIILCIFGKDTGFHGKLFKDYRKSFGFSSSAELSTKLIMLDKQDSIFIYWLLDFTEARLDDADFWTVH